MILAFFSKVEIQHFKIFAMKKVFKLILRVCLFANVVSVSAQDKPEENTLEQNYFQLTPRIGYDFPTYNNDTPYIDYEGALDVGLSLDYYWNWLGLGIDFDYIMNHPKSTFPT